jgi:Zn-dependent peptidase ImmA (M78 family)
VDAEQRANAFAAELLLPRAAVAAALQRGGVAAQVVAALKRRFGVSGQIVAWQAIRSDAFITKATLAFLRELVPPKDQPNFDRAAASR